MHTCIHAYMHTYIHTCMHTYIHTCMHTYIHTYIHTYMHAHIHTCIHTYMHTYCAAISLWKTTSRPTRPRSSGAMHRCYKADEGGKFTLSCLTPCLTLPYPTLPLPTLPCHQVLRRHRRAVPEAVDARQDVGAGADCNTYKCMHACIDVFMCMYLCMFVYVGRFPKLFTLVKTWAQVRIHTHTYIHTYT